MISPVFKLKHWLSPSLDIWSLNVWFLCYVLLVLKTAIYCTGKRMVYRFKFCSYEDGGSMTLRNVGTLPHRYTASQHRKTAT